MIVVDASAPARVLLARGVAVALDRRATCRVERTDGGVFLESKESLVRAEAARLGELRVPAALRPLARLLAALGLHEGVRVVGHGRVPPGTGLGTEVALIVAAAGAALRLLGREATHAEVARLAREALRDDDGREPDALDVGASLKGGVVAAGAEGGVARVSADPARVEEALLLSDVGVAARPGPSAGGLSDDERTVRDDFVAALAARDDAAVPALVARGWEATCRAHAASATPEADTALAIARDLGGAGRPCGAGGGGLVVLWLPVDRRDEAQDRLRAVDVRMYPCRIDLLGLEVEP